MSQKTIRSLHPAQRDDIGDLITQRPLPGPGIDQLDPFLFLNHHGPQTYPQNNRGLPFGPHPHRGFETVTFILEGMLAHQDSAGHESIIKAGGVQWMTAGRGIIHAEVSPAEFRQHGGPLEILQLWINLPARLKMAPPAYTGLQRADIPALRSADGKSTINLVAGQWEGVEGPLRSLTGVFMSTIEMQPGAHLTLSAPMGNSVFLYVVRGAVGVGPATASAVHLAAVSAQGDDIVLASSDGALLLFGHAEPTREPVVSHGPFVMNTHEEIAAAIRDYQAGLFGAPL